MNKLHLKIYKKSQLVLLRKINPLLQKFIIPEEIIKGVEKKLYDKQFGENGFTVIILEPLHNDRIDILDTLDYYPRRLKFSDELTGVDVGKTKSWMIKGREWYVDKLLIKGEKSYIWVFYSMRVKDIYY